MDGAISIVSFADDASTAALVGSFTGENTEFLAQHLEELTGDVTLECEHLEAVDASSASILRDFQRRREANGQRVRFLDLPSSCRDAVLQPADDGRRSVH